MALVLGTNAKDRVVSPNTGSSKKKKNTTPEEPINTYVAPAYVIPRTTTGNGSSSSVGTTPTVLTAPTKTTQKTTTTPTKTTTTTKTTTPTTTKTAASAPVLSLPGLAALPSADSYGERPTVALPDLYTLPSVDSYGTRPTYQQSQMVQDAYNTYQQYLATKPGAYESNYQAQIDSLLGDIMNRPAFSYDFNADPMYQMYRDNYVDQGRQAMIDATANAAALTGGYGNSYAATAGQQAYQAHLQQLNNIIPELWQMAYNVYLNEGDDMRANMSLLQSLEDTDYNRYRDTVSDWQTDRAFLYNVYDNEYNRDYGMYRDTVGDWESDRAFSYNADMDRYNASVAERNFAYQQYRDSVGDWEADRAFNYGAGMDQYNASVAERDFAYQQYLDALSQYNYENEFAYQQAQDALALAARSSGGGSSGGSGSSSGSSSKNSSGYSDIAKGVQNRSGVAALEYLDNAVNGGIITPEQADYLSTINGLSFGGSDENTNGTSSTPVFNQTEMSAREAYLRRRVQSKDATSAEINELDRILMAKKG